MYACMEPPVKPRHFMPCHVMPCYACPWCRHTLTVVHLHAHAHTRSIALTYTWRRDRGPCWPHPAIRNPAPRLWERNVTTSERANGYARWLSSYYDLQHTGIPMGREQLTRHETRRQYYRACSCFSLLFLHHHTHEHIKSLLDSEQQQQCNQITN